MPDLFHINLVACSNPELGLQQVRFIFLFVCDPALLLFVEPGVVVDLLGVCLHLEGPLVLNSLLVDFFGPGSPFLLLDEPLNL